MTKVMASSMLAFWSAIWLSWYCICWVVRRRWIASVANVRRGSWPWTSSESRIYTTPEDP